MFCVTVDCTEYKNVAFLLSENVLQNFVEGSWHGIGCVPQAGRGKRLCSSANMWNGSLGPWLCTEW
jgi:hypothetical protein